MLNSSLVRVFGSACFDYTRAPSAQDMHVVQVDGRRDYVCGLVSFVMVIYFNTQISSLVSNAKGEEAHCSQFPQPCCSLGVRSQTEHSNAVEHKTLTMSDVHVLDVTVMIYRRLACHAACRFLTPVSYRRRQCANPALVSGKRFSWYKCRFCVALCYFVCRLALYI